MTEIEFMADRVSITGPKGTDNSFVVKLDVGEYMAQQVAMLLVLSTEKNLKVVISDE